MAWLSATPDPSLEIKALREGLAGGCAFGPPPPLCCCSTLRGLAVMARRHWPFPPPAAARALPPRSTCAAALSEGLRGALRLTDGEAPD
jgi:hypothetical protein